MASCSDIQSFQAAEAAATVSTNGDSPALIDEVLQRQALDREATTAPTALLPPSREPPVVDGSVLPAMQPEPSKESLKTVSPDSLDLTLSEEASGRKSKGRHKNKRRMLHWMKRPSVFFPESLAHITPEQHKTSMQLKAEETALQRAWRTLRHPLQTYREAQADYEAIVMRKRLERVATQSTWSTRKSFFASLPIRRRSSISEVDPLDSTQPMREDQAGLSSRFRRARSYSSLRAKRVINTVKSMGNLRRGRGNASEDWQPGPALASTVSVVSERPPRISMDAQLSPGTTGHNAVLAVVNRERGASAYSSTLVTCASNTESNASLKYEKLEPLLG